MHAAGFMADLMGFQAQGAIGVAAEIVLDPAQPEIGQPVLIRCLGVADGTLRASDGQQWPVQDGSRLRLPAARAMTLALCDADGRVAAQQRIEPLVVVPRLLDWGLPLQPDYASGRLQPRLRTEDCAELTLWWRPLANPGHPGDPGDPDHDANANAEPVWQALAGPVADIALPPQPTTLALRAVLRSRHAGLDPAATAEHITSVTVGHPAPDWSLLGPAEVPRHGPAALQLRARWVRGARLRAAGQARSCAAQALRRHALTEPLQLPTQALGAVAVEVEVESLDGQTSLHRCQVQVMPRTARCDWQALPDGRVAYSLHAAQPLALQIPGLGLELPLPDADGHIEHSCSFATRARLVYADDLGRQLHCDLELCLPPPAWPDLPALPALSWA